MGRMGVSFTRVTTQSGLGLTVFILTTVILFAVGIALKKKKQVRPWPLFFFTTAASLLTLSPLPRLVWMNREILVVCMVSLAILMFQSIKARPQRFFVPFQIIAPFL